jgi:hypothetical protein
MAALEPERRTDKASPNRLLLFLIDDEKVAVPLGWTLSPTMRDYLLRGTQSPHICFDLREPIGAWLRGYDALLPKFFEDYLNSFLQMARHPQARQFLDYKSSYYDVLDFYRAAVVRSLDDLSSDRLPPLFKERGVGLGTALLADRFGGAYRVGAALLIDYACAIKAHYDDLAQE